VPFAKRKPDRSPLQRLSDQRRSLALAGLAVGAAISAAIFRRKRGGEPAMPPPKPPRTGSEGSAPQPESGPPAAVEVPAPAAPEPPADAATSTSADTAPELQAEATSPSTSEPATGELSAEEASILAVLAQHGRTDEDRTVIAVATSLERQSADVAEVLRKLHAEGVVAGELYTATGDKIWAVTERGVRRLGAQH
jgi:hypothetical protein